MAKFTLEQIEFLEGNISLHTLENGELAAANRASGVAADRCIGK